MDLQMNLNELILFYSKSIQRYTYNYSYLLFASVWCLFQFSVILVGVTLEWDSPVNWGGRVLTIIESDSGLLPFVVTTITEIE